MLAAGIAAWIPATAAGDKPQTELSGIVVDRATNQPIQGAFVLTYYLQRRSGLAATILMCVKSRGMLTGKDGKFSFPIEKQDGLSPFDVDVIHVDYWMDRTQYPAELPSGKRTFAGFRVEMAKQDYTKPNIRRGSEFSFCADAISREAAVASAQYFKIMAEQQKRAGWTGETALELARMLESLDGSQSRTRWQ